MLVWIIDALWNSAIAQFGIAGLVLAGAIAAFIWLPLPGVRHLSVAVASVCCVFLFLGPKLYMEGVNHERAIWKAAEQAAEQRGADARRDAETEIAREPDPPPVAAAPGGPAQAGKPWRRRQPVPATGGMHHDLYERDRP
jgi:hypothetical protein